MKWNKRGLAAGVTALTAMLTVGGAASADVAVFDDAGDVTSTVDILRVRVDNGETRPGQIWVRVVQDDMVIGDEVTVFLDIRPRDPGPEWKVVGRPAAEWGLMRIERWKSVGKEFPCAAGAMRMNEDTDVTRVILPRKCIDAAPGKVRVAVRVTRDDPAAVDWAKAARTWLPWVPIATMPIR